MTSLRRQSRAKIVAVATCPIKTLHQNQLAEIPSVLLIAETKTGVSAAKVVATMEVPATNHPSDRPARKKSAVPLLAFLVNHAPIPIAEATYSPTIVQSIHVIARHHTPLMVRCCTLSGEMATIHFVNRIGWYANCPEANFHHTSRCTLNE